MLTEKQALEKSLAIWIWVYKNPGKMKENSPYWSELNKTFSACWLCHHYYLCGACILCIKEIPCYYGCFNKWEVSCFKKDIYGAKISAAYIAAKIRHQLRKINKKLNDKEIARMVNESNKTPKEMYIPVGEVIKNFEQSFEGEVNE